MLKISIIVPIYNSEAYLEKCLFSLQAQTYSNLEVLMIDDGSTDRSAEICIKYSNADKRFQYYYQENQGQSAARNHGLQRANGDIIGFCDSDDWVSPDYYDLLCRPLTDSLCDCAICGYQITDGTNIILSTLPQKDEILETKELALRFLEYTKDSMLNSVCNKLFRRVQIVNGFPTDMTCGEDLFFCMNYLATAKNIAIVCSDGYFYYNPPVNSVKYKLNDARQCEKYSSCVLPFLQKTLSKSEANQIYEIFSCGNIGRDVAMIAKAMPYSKAFEMILEFYEISTLERSINSNVWQALGKKYRVIGILLKKRHIKTIIFLSKLLGNRV